MWSTYWFGIYDANSDLCGEEFFTELEDATEEQHKEYAQSIFPDEKITCFGKIMESEAEMMGLDTY